MELVATAVGLVLTISLALSVLANGMRVGKEDLLFFLHDKRLLLISLLSIFVLSPVAAIAVIEWIDIPLVIRVAIATMSASIISPLLPWKQLEASGDRHYGVGLTLIVAVLAVGFVPLQVDLLGRVSHHPYGVPAWEIARYVLAVVVLPTALGVLIGYFWKGFVRRVAIPLARFSGLGMLVASVIVLAISLRDFPHILSFHAVMAMVLFNLATLGVGHLLGGPQRERAVVLGVSTASRHPALALAIAAVNYPGEKYTAAVLLCVIVNMAVTAPYLRWHAKKRAVGSDSPTTPMLPVDR
ncbi:MAG: hypothetical protein M3Y45_02610 [Actinomycetota bacterium]|nr:hypothetical protein [Actinomycetota bacterium]